jgi:hypothetical protein
MVTYCALEFALHLRQNRIGRLALRMGLTQEDIVVYSSVFRSKVLSTALVLE